MTDAEKANHERIPADWYPDPLSDGKKARWWDGTQWTSTTGRKDRVSENARKIASHVPKMGGADAPSPGDAGRLVKQAVRGYVDRVNQRTASLDQALKAHSADVKARDKEAEEAKRGRELAKYGGWFIKHLVLYEDRLGTSSGEIPLSPDLRARIEVEGQLQSVQGWTFKGTKDLRDVFLHLEGDQTAAVVKLPIKGSTASGGARSDLGTSDWSAGKTTENVRSFAQAIELAARRSPQVAVQIKERRAEALDRLADAWANTAPAQAALSELDATARDSAQLDAACDAALQLAEQLEEGSRHRKKLTSQVTEAKQRRDHIAAAARQRIESFPNQIRTAEERARHIRPAAEKLRAEAATEKHAGDDAEQAPREPPGSSGPGADDERLARLKQLGELRESGVLTEEEFQAEKARILDTS